MPYEYGRWNEALADRFFPSGQTQPVYLDPDVATISDLASALEIVADPVVSFVESVKYTLWLDQPRHFLRRHDWWFADWQARKRSEIPPMVGVLALFSFASTHMEDDRGYYKHLAQLIGVEDVDGMASCYNRRVRYYWSALNSWIDSGRRGVPTAYPQDNRANVSLLLTQRFLSAAERGKLPLFFARTGLTPGVPLTIAEMQDHVRRNQHLLPFELTNEWHRHPERFAEVSCIEFESWTGGVLDEDDAPTSAPLLLGLFFDRRKDLVQFPLAVATANAPSAEYFFEGASDESGFLTRAVGELGGAVTFDPGEAVRFAVGSRLSADAVKAFLVEGTAATSRSGFRLERSSAPLVVFLPITANSYIEAARRHAPLGAPFSVLARNDLADDSDSSFAQLMEAEGAERTAWDGCPEGWALYRDVEFSHVPDVPEGNDAELVRQLVPLPQGVVIDIRGGVVLPGPTRAGRAWLACSPPEVVVTGSIEIDAVELHLRPFDGTEAPNETLRHDTDGRWVPRSGIPPGDHQLFAIANDKTVAQRRLRTVSSDTPRAEARAFAHAHTDPWNAISALPRSDTCTVVGADWAELQQRDLLPPEARPPVNLAVAPGQAEPEERERNLEPTQDVRPEKFRQPRIKRRSTGLKTVPGAVAGASIRSRYEHEIRQAVDQQAGSFKAPDGRLWTIRYFDNDEIVVRPKGAFAPMGRFEVSYE
jgi:hypothetical protein